MAEGRDEKGRMIKGHPYIPPQPGNKSGRKPLLSSEVSEWLKTSAPKALQKLEELCLAGDRAACEYLCDRHWGKTQSNVNLDQSGDINITYTIGKGYEGEKDDKRG